MLTFMVLCLTLCGAVSAADNATLENSHTSLSTVKSDDQGGSLTNTLNLTDSNYSSYFHDDGTLRNDTVNPGDTLKLSGIFYNRNMTIDLPVKLVGDGAVLYNGTIKITEKGSGTTISNMGIKNDNQQGIIIYKSGNNTIENSTVTVNQDKQSYALYLYKASNNSIRNNTFTTTGNYVTVGVLLYRSSSNEVTGNIIRTVGTNVTLPYLSSVSLGGDIGSVNEIFPTYGVLLLFSSDNNMKANNVSLTSGFKNATVPSSTCRNSMVGVDIYYDSHNNTVEGNNITVTGKNPYSYGLGVLGAVWGTGTTAENNTFSNNNVQVNGSYFATGFIAGLSSFNTTLTGNNIRVSAVNYAYGVTLESSKATKITGNTVNTEAEANYALELYTSNSNTIEWNNISATGNYNYGIAAYGSDNNTVNRNVIKTSLSIGDKPSSSYHEDAIPLGNAGIYFMAKSSNNTLSMNSINATGLYAVDSSEATRTTTINNYLVSDSGNKRGDDAVNSGSGDVISGNYGEIPCANFTFKGENSSDLTVKFNDNSTGSVTSWNWNFGDGTNSSERNPSHTYARTGTYTVTLTIKCAGGINSTATRTFDVDTAAPLVYASPEGGSYNTSNLVTLKASDDLDSDPDIYYTTDGSTPTTVSSRYTGPITISKTTTLKFIAVDDAGNISRVCNETYTIPEADVYVTSGVNEANPKVGASVVVTLKVGNNGPDTAHGVVVTYKVPEGMEFVSASTDMIDASAPVYDAATRTVTWNIGDVPVGDPKLFVTLRVLSTGNLTGSASITSTSFDPVSTDDTAFLTVEPASGELETSSHLSTDRSVSVSAAEVPMQSTGAPLTGFLMAVLTVFSGLGISKLK